MNQVGVPIAEHEQIPVEGQQAGEIPSYPGEEQYSPAQDYAANSTESFTPTPIPSLEKPQIVEQVNLYNSPENQIIPQSITPELQTNISVETTRAGERIFVNPELGQSTFKGGVSSQQLVSKVAGYYTVQQGLVSDPKSGLLQQTATAGDPTSATTWQSTILFKILQAFWSALGISN